jgi:hypothetical protein
MAKLKTSKDTKTQKVTFGVKRTGKAKKSFGPKTERPKKYRGQGR